MGRPDGTPGRKTKRLIFDAATGRVHRPQAGARLDRIASAARANEQLIYAYFGNARADPAVMSEHVARLLSEFRFVADDLPGWAGVLLRPLPRGFAARRIGRARPQEAQHRIPIIAAAIRDRVRRLTAAQADDLADQALAWHQPRQLEPRSATTNMRVA